MEPTIEAFLAAIAALNGLKNLFSKSNSEIERTELKKLIKESERKIINKFSAKIAQLEKRKEGREVSLQLVYCHHCGKLVSIRSGMAFGITPCLNCGSLKQGKVKTIRMWFKYSLQGLVTLTECPQCGSINEISTETSAKFGVIRCKCHHCGYKFRSFFTHRFRVNL